jgi:hypothetical protein
MNYISDQIENTNYSFQIFFSKKLSNQNTETHFSNILNEKDKALEPLDLIDDLDDIIKNINIEEISSVFNSSLSIFIKEE